MDLDTVEWVASIGRRADALITTINSNTKEKYKEPMRNLRNGIEAHLRMFEAAMKERS